MKLKAVIDFIDEIKPNAFTPEQKTRWISEAEGRIQTEIFLLAPAEVIPYDYGRDANSELLVAAPYDDLYTAYLAAMVDYANGEYSRYANTAEMFKARYTAFARWFSQRYRPADKLEDFICHFDRG